MNILSSSMQIMIRIMYFILIFKQTCALVIENNSRIKINKLGLQLTQSLNIKRQEHMHNVCQIISKNIEIFENLNQADHLLIDKTHKFLYCYVPKVACTNWKRMLMILTKQWVTGANVLDIPADSAHKAGRFKTFNSLNFMEKREVFANYTRFIIVRHPFERLLSAYRNKLEGESASAKYFQSRIGKTIVSNLRINAKNDSLQRGNDVTFTEFVQYLLSPKLSKFNNSFNEHWEPITNLCHPCAIKYNVIGKYETLIDDSALVLESIRANANLTFPAGQKTSGTKDQLKRYFEKVPVSLIVKLFDIYRNDFKLFNYGLSQVLGFDIG